MKFDLLQIKCISFYGCDFSNSVFLENSCLCEVKFDFCDFTNATLKCVHTGTFRGAIFKNTNVEGYNGMSMEEAKDRL